MIERFSSGFSSASPSPLSFPPNFITPLVLSTPSPTSSFFSPVRVSSMENLFLRNLHHGDYCDLFFLCHESEGGVVMVGCHFVILASFCQRIFLSAKKGGFVCQNCEEKLQCDLHFRF